MGSVALTVGIAVLLVTAASQTGLLGAHDFAAVALIGLLGAVICLVMVVTTRTRGAVGGLALSLLPVVLLVVYVTSSDG